MVTWKIHWTIICVLKGFKMQKLRKISKLKILLYSYKRFALPKQGQKGWKGVLCNEPFVNESV